MNGDGLEDILIASYSGVPQWIERSKDGYEKPTSIVDKNGDLVVLSTFWDSETDDWGELEHTGSHGHCTSVASVDWDHDGDMDLLLGCYRNGGLYLRLNEGSATEMKFASTNQVVEVAGKPVEFEGGISTPRVADWDGDGLFDIVIGTIQGEVTLLRNAGSKGEPMFPELTTLVEALPGESGAKQVKRVAAAEDGSPIGPGSSFHIELTDYDGDSDLDLLVGGRSEWLTGPLKESTEEELELAAKFKKESSDAYSKFSELKKAAKAASEEELEKFESSKEARELLAKYRSLRLKAIDITRDPTERGDFVWLFRRK